jgi:hypothetical protein
MAMARGNGGARFTFGEPRVVPAGWPPDVAPRDLITAAHINTVKASVYAWPGEVNAGGFRLINTGNVGIGTASPIGKLDVIVPSQDSTVTSSGGFGFRLALGVANTDEALLCGVYSGGYSWIQAIKAGTAHRNLALNPHGGNVGIGTASPASRLHLQEPDATDTPIGAITLARYWGGASNVRASAIFHYCPSGSRDTLAFAVSDGSAPAQLSNIKMTINAAGNVGIGTASPAERLSVQGGNLVISAFNDASNTQYLAQHGIFFREGFSPAAGADEAQRRNVSITTGRGTGDLGDAMDINAYHHLSIYTSAAERMRIANDGNVGIGCSPISGKLELRIAVDQNFWIGLSGGDVTLQALNNAQAVVLPLRINASKLVIFNALPASNPGAGTKQLWYDPADGNRVKYAA